MPDMNEFALIDLNICRKKLMKLSEEAASIDDMQLSYWLGLAASYVSSAHLRIEQHIQAPTINPPGKPDDHPMLESGND